MAGSNTHKKLRPKRFLKNLKIIIKNNNSFSVAINYIACLFHRERRISATVDGEVISIRCNTSDIQLAHKCLTSEFSTVIALAKYRHALIIDAGGHIGSSSIAFARAFPNSTVVCIEPHPENYEIACANTKKYPNIIVVNAALTAKPGTIGLFDRGTGNWGYTILSNPMDTANPQELGRVKCITVDQIIDGHEKTGIDILKLDVEGAEREILENSGSWMSRCEILLVELHERIVPGCLRAYIHATEGRVDISSQGEKAISLRDGTRHSALPWETEEAS